VTKNLPKLSLNFPNDIKIELVKQDQKSHISFDRFSEIKNSKELGKI